MKRKNKGLGEDGQLARGRRELWPGVGNNGGTYRGRRGTFCGLYVYSANYGIKIELTVLSPSLFQPDSKHFLLLLPLLILEIKT